MNAMIAPSVLASDFSRLGIVVEEVGRAGADLIHFDIMDGKFVPNLTFGPPVVRAVRQYSKLPFDVHLMVERPWELLDDFVRAGADNLTVHAEACQDLARVVAQIRTLGVAAGVALNPATPVSHVRHVLGDIQLLLVMTVSSGFGGQDYIEAMTPKIEEAADLISIENPECKLEVDGGIDATTTPIVVRAGARVLVAGSSVFGAASVAEGITSLREAAAGVSP